MATLYRKYRPQSFESVSGQETIVTTLQNEIKLERLSHAYLFAGPRGVGKTTLARLFAKAINCTEKKKGSAEPCNTCSTCTAISAGKHIDIMEIDAASQTGVDNVRENIIENASVNPTTLKYKIFIIDEVHMLSGSAFNALLKTLEEPPAHVIFILATTELHKLPATVISRCERYTFKKIPFDQMLARLKNICKEEKVKIETEVLERIVRKSEGGLRDAESLLGQILSLNLKEITAENIQIVLPLSSSEALLTYLEALTGHAVGSAIACVAEQVDNGTELNQFALDLVEMLRYILLVQMKAEKTIATDYSAEAVERLKKLSQAIPASKLLPLIDYVIKRRLEIKYAPLPQLPLELLAVEADMLLSGTAPVPPAGNKIVPQAEIKTKAPEPPKPEVVKVEEAEPVKPLHETAIEAIATGIKQVITTITSDSEIKTTLADIQSRWKELAEKSSKSLPSMNIVLKMCTLKAIHGNTLIVTVPYSLHKQKLDEPKNRGVIEGTLEAFFNERIRFACEILEPVRVPEPEIELQSLATEFGGEVIG